MVQPYRPLSEEVIDERVDKLIDQVYEALSNADLPDEVREYLDEQLADYEFADLVIKEHLESYEDYVDSCYDELRMEE